MNVQSKTLAKGKYVWRICHFIAAEVCKEFVMSNA